MSDASHSNRLPVLATEIVDCHTQSVASAARAVEKAIAAGRLLIEAKSLVEHGQWLPWLQAHARVSPRTAQNYMALARSGLKYESVSRLGLRGALDFITDAGMPRPAADECVMLETDHGHLGIVDRASAEADLYRLRALWLPAPEVMLNGYVSETKQPVPWGEALRHSAMQALGTDCWEARCVAKDQPLAMLIRQTCAEMLGGAA